MTASSSPARRWRTFRLRRCDYWPELCRDHGVVARHTSTPPFTSAGARRRGFTIIMASPSGRFRRSFSVCSATRWRSRTSCFSAALTMSSGCRIPEKHDDSARGHRKGAGAQDPLVLGNRRRIRRQNRQDGRQVFLMGHAEYDRDTLKREYHARCGGQCAGFTCRSTISRAMTRTKTPLVTWRSCAHLLYGNWLNYFVYQTVPYDITRIQSGERTEE